MLIFLLGCNKDKNNTIVFAVSAQYPPFIYLENGKIHGFEIDIANLICQKLNKESVFKDMQFSSQFPALNNNQADVAIGAITITEERKHNFDFSIPYYFDGITAIFKSNIKINNINDLKDKIIAVQMGTTQEIWIKKYFPNNQILLMNDNNQIIELLKNNTVDIGIVDEAQGKIFSSKNQDLNNKLLTTTKNGYGIVFSKNSKLRKEIDEILKEIEKNGEMQKIKDKWFGVLK